MADIDYFKRINDQFGHDVGDQVLQFLAQRMQESSRPDDLVCRSGGEEFILLLPKTDASIAYTAAERLRKHIAREICPSVGQAVTMSFGVASWPCGEATVAEVMKHVDQALYAAKAAGRNRVHRSQTA